MSTAGDEEGAHWLAVDLYHFEYISWQYEGKKAAISSLIWSCNISKMVLYHLEYISWQYGGEVIGARWPEGGGSR
jgi:hypothetical protein